MKIDDTVRDILAECRVEGNVLYLPDRQLERAVYTAVNKVLTSMGGEWNRKAKGHTFEESPESALEEIVLSGEYTDSKKEFQFFETPEALAVRLCDNAEITSDSHVLEPSVGKGRIADEILKRKPKGMLCVEKNTEMQKYLKDKPYLVLNEDFLDMPEEMFVSDRIVMNPPFSKQQDIDHVRKAFQVLAPGGILVAVMSCSHTYRQNKKSVEFREFLVKNHAEVEMLPEETFKESGTLVQACIVRLRKVV